MDTKTTTAHTFQRKTSSLAARVRAFLGCAVGLCVAATPAAAAEWGAAVGAGVVHSDNINRAPDGDSVTIATADMAGQIVDVGRTYDLDLEAAVAFREYLDSGYDSDVLPQLRGEVNWAPFPEHFVWTVRDNYGQVALAPTDGLQPSDRQNVNVFSTGPAFTIPLGRRWNIQLGGRYSDVYYEDDAFDNDRLMGALTVEREISRNQAAYIRGYSNRTEFKDQQFGGYDIQGVFLGYAGVGTRTGVSAEIGVEELHDGGEVKDATFIDLNISRSLSERLDASLGFVSRYADAAEIFALDQDLEPQLGGTTNIQVSGDPIAQDRASLELNWEGLRTTAGVLALWTTEDTDSTTLPDREIYGFAVRGSRRLSSTTRLGASAYFLRENRSGVVEESQDDIVVSVDLEVRLGEKLSILTLLERYSRNNSPGDYDENRVVLLVRYTPRTLRNDLPSFYDRRLRRRFVGGDENEEELR